MIQDKIDCHLADNESELGKLHFDIHNLSLAWGVPGYHYHLSGHVVPKYMPWKDSPYKYNTALSDEKMHVIEQLLDSAPDGDCVEMGVYTGGVTRMMLDKGRKVFAFDTFEGIKGAGNSDMHKDGDYNGGSVSDYIDGAVIVKGMIPITLDSAEVGEIAFAHIDMDVYEPTVHALEFVYERLVHGGTIVLDDYGNVTTPGVKKAVDEFTKGRKLFLPNSQMLIFK